MTERHCPCRFWGTTCPQLLGPEDREQCRDCVIGAHTHATWKRLYGSEGLPPKRG